MKQQILLAIFGGLSLFFYSRANEYIPFVNEAYVWSYCDIVKTGSEEYNLHYLQFQLSGDTVINSVRYIKLYEKDCSANTKQYKASLREDGKKVYALYNDGTEEVLIYDFGLSAGDSILSPFNKTTFYKVIKTDSVDIAGGRRKRIELDFDTWIEGVGTLNRFMLYPLQALPLYETGIRINYQKQHADITYQTNEWYFNNGDCGASSVNYVDETQHGVYFISREVLMIESGWSDGYRMFELFDLRGNLLFKRNIDSTNNTFNVDHIPNGLYFFRLSGDNKNSINGKVIKE